MSCLLDRTLPYAPDFDLFMWPVLIVSKKGIMVEGVLLLVCVGVHGEGQGVHVFSAILVLTCLCVPMLHVVVPLLLLLLALPP